MPLSPYAKFGQSTLGGTNATRTAHTVRGGETIMSIAAIEYPLAGYDSELWRQIAEANKVEDLDAIVVNQILMIPSPNASTT